VSAPGELNWPSAHGAHELAPALLDDVPSGHGAHADTIPPALKEPGAHAVATPFAHALPAPHGSAVVVPAAHT
jgi:hypothetical protein